MPVSLVIPGRNCSATIGPCLEAVVPMLDRGELAEVIFVDDGSTDNTVAIAQRYPIRLIRGGGRGAGAARNLGWRSAAGDLIWFIDSDCVANDDALVRLRPHLDDPRVGGVSGSYGNMCPEALLACLIHEEIIARHERMPTRVDFLATFNVLYRRAALEAVDGFDERFLKGQDAELSWRVMAAGYELGFEFQSRVRHYHETNLRKYLRIQRQQGYWRAWLHLTHRGHAAGDSYSSIVDHLQPPLAMLTLAALPTLLCPAMQWLFPLLFVLLAALHVPLAVRLTRRTGRARYSAFWPMSLIRTFFRGVGLSAGVVSWAFHRRHRRRGAPSKTATSSEAPIADEP